MLNLTLHLSGVMLAIISSKLTWWHCFWFVSVLDSIHTRKSHGTFWQKGQHKLYILMKLGKDPLKVSQGRLKGTTTKTRVLDLQKN